MLIGFFFELRAGGVPVSLSEFLTLLQALRARVAIGSAQDFYYLARLALVKDERHFDRFDRVFARFFQGIEQSFADLLAQLPADWLRSLGERHLSEAEQRRIEALGGWDQLLQTLRERLREQQQRHEGGSKWIGTQGTSPFGSDGYHPEGIRIGGQSSGEHRAVKVWEQRQYRNLDDGVELGTRAMKLALRRLRRFAREGAPEELDLAGTIDATARNAGMLDLRLLPERRHSAKVLLCLDVGGSMDGHIQVCEELFSAARSEFRHLEHFYFHNFVYEHLWRDNRRRSDSRVPTRQLLHTYGRDYQVVLVGDANMSPYEITQPGGSIEHWNAEAGAAWLSRLCVAFPRLVWLNPLPPAHWPSARSVQLTRRLIGNRMFALTLQGLDAAMRSLRQPAAPPSSLRASDADSASQQSQDRAD